MRYPLRTLMCSVARVVHASCAADAHLPLASAGWGSSTRTAMRRADSCRPCSSASNPPAISCTPSATRPTPAAHTRQAIRHLVCLATVCMCLGGMFSAEGECPRVGATVSCRAAVHPQCLADSKAKQSTFGKLVQRVRRAAGWALLAAAARCCILTVCSACRCSCGFTTTSWPQRQQHLVQLHGAWLQMVNSQGFRLEAQHVMHWIQGAVHGTGRRTPYGRDDGHSGRSHTRHCTVPESTER
jgi:hypothetical protein